MDMLRLTRLDSLTRLLETDERERPGLILIGSAASPHSFELRPYIQGLAAHMPQFAFYELDLDDYREPRQARALVRLLKAWRIDSPSQVLLPSTCPPVTLHATRSEDISKALKHLY